MVFCTEILDAGGLESCSVGRVYGADGARLSRTPPIQNLGAENHMLQLNI